MTQSVNPEWTIERVIASLPERDRQRLEASGQIADKANWAWGAYAEKLIEQNVPKMYVYLALGKIVGRSATTIRNCYYTHRAFSDGEREEYEALAWSIFNHARQCDDPDRVLTYAHDERAGYDEVKAQFPITDPDEDEMPKPSIPTWTMPIYRRLLGLPEARAERAKELMNELIKILEDE